MTLNKTHTLALEHAKRCGCDNLPHAIAWTNWKLEQTEQALAQAERRIKELNDERIKADEEVFQLDMRAQQAERALAEVKEDRAEILKERQEFCIEVFDLRTQLHAAGWCEVCGAIMGPLDPKAPYHHHEPHPEWVALYQKFQEWEARCHATEAQLHAAEKRLIALDLSPNDRGEMVTLRTKLAERERDELKAQLHAAQEAIDKARRETASDPDNVWCRNATAILNAAMRDLTLRVASPRPE